MPLERREAARPVVRQRLAAAVENDPIVGRPADDTREDGEGAVAPRGRADTHLRAIEVGVVARPDFRQPFSRAEKRAVGVAPTLSSSQRTPDRAARSRRSAASRLATDAISLSRPRGVRVTGVAQEALEAESWQRRDFLR